MKDRSFYQRIGRLGGLQTRKNNEGTDIYEQMGLRSGNQLLKEFGKEYFSALGKKSWKSRKAAGITMPVPNRLKKGNKHEH